MSQAWTIFGTGAHARKAAHCALCGGDSVVAFVDENPAATSPLPGVPVMTAAAWRASADSGSALFVAIGRAEVRRRRTRLDRALLRVRRSHGDVGLAGPERDRPECH